MTFQSIIFPSATENEINGKDAANLLNGGVFVVCEGANMPTMPDGVEQFVKAGIDINALAAKLQNEGANSFVKSWNELMAVIASKSAILQEIS